MDAIAEKPKWTATDKKYEECNGEMVQLNANNYICTKFGLTQVHALELRYINNQKVSAAGSSVSFLREKTSIYNLNQNKNNTKG